MRRSLGIDHGDVRVGVALSDGLGFLAHPLETIDIRQTPPVARIRDLATKHDVETIVVGMPRNMDGSHGPAAQKVAAFVEELRAVAPCPVVTLDERLTTVSAQRSMRESGRKARDQKGVIDQAAAQLILQTWLDSQAGGMTDF